MMSILSAYSFIMYLNGVEGIVMKLTKKSIL